MPIYKLSFIQLGCFTVLISGCGNVANTYQDKAPLSSYSGTYSAADSTGTDGFGTAASDYNCPGSPNVKLNYDWDNNQSLEFTVCPAKTDVYKIQIHGVTRTNDTICVFPAQYIDASHIMAKRDSARFPIYQCGRAATGGINMTFPQTIFNAVFVVEDQDHNKMQLCLNSGNPNDCPKYFSYGRFK